MKCFACGTEPTGEPWECKCGGTRLPPVRVDAFVGRWCVHVIVCGIYTGAYKFDTEEQAQTDAADRRRKFGVLRCRYIVAPNDCHDGSKEGRHCE